MIGGFTNMATLSLIALMALVRMIIILQKVAAGISTKVAYFSVFVSFSVGFGMAIGNINENNAQFAICTGDLLKNAHDRKAALEKKFLWRLNLGVSVLFFAITVISYSILIIFLLVKRAKRELIVKNDKKNNIMTLLSQGTRYEQFGIDVFYYTTDIFENTYNIHSRSPLTSFLGGLH